MAKTPLLDVAVREFGSRGLEGASTRQIAAAAGTAMSAITYHYGGKDGLYLAAADHIANEMAGLMAPALVAERAIADHDTAGARAAIQRMLGAFADRMASESGAEWALFIMREQLNPTGAFDRIYAGLMGQMLERLVQLICIATGMRDQRKAGIVAVTFMGQALAIRACRAAALRLLDQPDVDAATAAAFRAQGQINIEAILNAIIAAPQEQI